MITVKDIEKLATLARVKIDDSEKTQLVKEIDSILAYIDQIKKATVGNAIVGSATDTGAGASIVPENRIGAVKNVMRPDVPCTISLEDRERILSEVPDREGDFVAVKKIL